MIRGGGDTALWQVIATSGYAHNKNITLFISYISHQKHKPHLLPHSRGVEQEHWQSFSSLPSAARAGSDKIKANK